MLKSVALATGIAMLFVASAAAAKPPQPARDHVTHVSTVVVHGRAARPQAVQEIARVAWPFSSDRVGPTLTARIGNAVSRAPF